MEFNQMMNSWINSNKYKKLREELIKKTNALMELDVNKRDEIIEHIISSGMTEEELINNCTSIIELDSSVINQEDLEWWSFQNAMGKDKEEMYRDINKTLITWYAYLKIYQEKEHFELCADITKCIDIELKDFLYMIETYFDIDDQDKENTIYINNQLKKLFLDI